MKLTLTSVFISILFLFSGLGFKLFAQDCGFTYNVEAVYLSGTEYELTAAFQMPADQSVSVSVSVNGEWMDDMSGQDGSISFNLPFGQYHVCFELNEDILNCAPSYCKTVQLGSDCNAEIDVQMPEAGVFICNIDGPAYNLNVDWNLKHISGATIANYTGMYFYYSLPQPGTYEVCATFSLLDGTCYGNICETIIYTESNCEADFSATPLNYSGAYEFSNNSATVPGAAEIQYAWYIDTLAVFIGEDAELVYQFPQSGSYQVCHTVVYKNSYGEIICTDQHCKIVVSPPSCQFELAVQQDFQSLHVQAVNLSDYMQGSFVFQIIHQEDTLYMPGQQSILLSFPASGIYEIALHFESFDGVCYHTAQTSVEVGGNNEDCLVDFSWALYEEISSGQMGIQFINTSGLAVQSLSWNFGDGYIVDSLTGNQIVHFYDQPGVYFACLVIVATDQCSSYYCQPVIFDPFEDICEYIDCVYPGDANYDGKVDVLDVLAIGLAFNSTGHTRMNANHNWTPQASLDWNKTVGELTFDFKHIDTDGSGMIDSADLTALDLNYGSTHESAGIDKPMSPDAEPMVFVDITGVSEAVFGEFTQYNITTDIFVGTDDAPAQNLYGIAMSLQYSTELPIEATVANIFHMDNVLTGNGVFSILYFKHLPDLNRIDIGLVRTDQQNASANNQQRVAGGEITLIGDIIGKPDGEGEDWDIEVPFEIEVLWVHAINNKGEDLQYFGQGDEAILTVISNAQQVIADNRILILPNPSAGMFQLINPGYSIEAVQIYSNLGQQVFAMKTENTLEPMYQFNLPNLSSGIYLLRIQTDKGLLVQRITIF